MSEKWTHISVHTGQNVALTTFQIIFTNSLPITFVIIGHFLIDFYLIRLFKVWQESRIELSELGSLLYTYLIWSQKSTK